MEKVKDTIYRQDAIDAICNACGKIDCDKMDKCEKLQLPPANCSEFPNNSDTISRQAAIDEIKALYEWHDTVTEDRAIDHLKRLPFAQPEREKGEWIPLISISDGKHHEWCGYQCSICGERTLRLMQYNFCPKCGADMREEQDEQRK